MRRKIPTDSLFWLSDNDNSYLVSTRIQARNSPVYPHNKTSYLGFYEGTNIVAYHRSDRSGVLLRGAGQFQHHRQRRTHTLRCIRQWYDEAEFSAAKRSMDRHSEPRPVVGGGRAGVSRRHEGAHLNARTARACSSMVENVAKPAEETPQAFPRARRQLDENSWLFYNDRICAGKRTGADLRWQQYRKLRRPDAGGRMNTWPLLHHHA